MKSLRARVRWSKGKTILTVLSCFVFISALFTVIYAGTGSAADPEYTWSELADDPEIYSTFGAMSADGNKVISLGMDMRISNDGGDTWSKVEGLPDDGWYYGPVRMSIDGSVIVACNNNDLVRSTDGGETWVVRALPGYCKSTSIDMARNDGHKLVFITDSYVYTSDDIGDSWTQQIGSGEAVVGVAPRYKSIHVSSDGTRLMAVSKYFDNNIWQDFSTGVYISSDGGTTWTRHSDMSALKLEIVAVSNDLQTAYANSYENSDYDARPLYVTIDGGITWTATSITGAVDTGFIRSDGTAVLMQDKHSGYGTRLTSIDNGVTWQTDPIDMPSFGVCDFISTPDGSSMFMFDCYNTLKSSDGGSTWSVSLLQGEQWWFALSASADGRIILALNADGQAYISHDWGNSWILRVMGDDLAGASMSADGSVMVISDVSPYALRGDKPLYISKDSGYTWQAIQTSGTGGRGDVVISDDGLTIASIDSSNRVHMSRDSGDTWSITSSVAPGSGAYGRIDMSSDGQSIVAAPNSGAEIYISHDDGATWAGSGFGFDPMWTWTDVAMSGDGQAIVATGYEWGVASKIMISRDGGNTWADSTGFGLPDTSRMSNNPSRVSVSQDGSVMLLSTFAGGLFVSTDGGGTWTDYGGIQQGLYIDGEIPTAMSADGSRLYAAGGSVFGASLTSDSDGGGDSNSGIGGESGGSGQETGDGESDTGSNNAGESASNDGDRNTDRLADTGQSMNVLLVAAGLMIVAGGVVCMYTRLR